VNDENFDEFEIPEEMVKPFASQEGENLNQLKEKLKLMQSEEGKQDHSTLSAYQKRIEKLHKQILEVEEQLVAEKPWVLRGEITSKERPVNSLLEVVLDFEHTAKPAPIVTEETTSSIEDIIKKRIKESSWDDVIRKKKFEAKIKDRVELPSEKSKIGLGEVYEKEYIKQVTGISEEAEKLTDQQTKILHLYKKICWHLDRLGHFHYAPKPDLEVKKTKNIAAIQMEEKLPISFSEVKTLAPEEVYAKSRAEIKGDGELTQEDRKRKRQTHKNVNKRTKEQKEQDKKNYVKNQILTSNLQNSRLITTSKRIDQRAQSSQRSPKIPLQQAVLCLDNCKTRQVVKVFPQKAEEKKRKANNCQLHT